MTKYIIKRFENELEQLRTLFIKFETVQDRKYRLKSHTKTYEKYSKTENNYVRKIIALRTVLIKEMQADIKIHSFEITDKALENFINSYMRENESEIKAFEDKYKSKKQITEEEIKEIIYNATLDYSELNIKDNRVLGYITVLVDEDELKELENIPYFYLDSYEIDINKYYESAGLTLLNENVKEIFPDVEFQFRKEAA